MFPECYDGCYLLTLAPGPSTNLVDCLLSAWRWGHPAVTRWLSCPALHSGKLSSARNSWTSRDWEKGRIDWDVSKSLSLMDFPGPVLGNLIGQRRAGGRQCDETGSNTEQMCHLEIVFCQIRKTTSLTQTEIFLRSVAHMNRHPLAGLSATFYGDFRLKRKFI